MCGLWFNVADGVIIVQNTRAPKREELTNPSKPAPQTPPPSFLSDIIFLIHARLCNSQAKCLQRLQYVFRDTIVNVHTFDMANWVSFRPDKKLWNAIPNWPNDPWPGNSFKPGIGVEYLSGNGILGTSNGVGVVYLLSQHRQQYGPRIVNEINLFSSKAGQLTIGFQILIH